MALVVIISAAGFFFFFLKPFKQGIRKGISTATDKERPFVSVDDFNYVQTTNGKNEWVLKAKNASYKKSYQVVTLKGVYFVYYLSNQREVHLTGTKGEMDLENRFVKIKGNVEVILSGDVRLDTELIVYDDRSKQISSPGQVRIRTPQCLITGQGLQADVSKRRLFLEHDVVTRISHWDSDFRL